MAVQKNFVVKNGIEVNENLIFADNSANKVGIGTTITPEKLQVNGGIGATSIVLSGVGTIPISFSNISNIGDAYIVSGVVTSITGTALTYTNADIGTLSADVGYVVSGVVTNLTGTISTITNINTTNLVGTIGTFTTADVTNLSVDNAYVVSGVVTNLTGTISTITNIDTTNLSVDNGYIVSGVVTNLTGTISTFTTSDITNLSVDNAYVVSGVVTNLTGTAATIGTVEIVSGIVTATSGVVTYYGDGRYLDLSNNSSAGIGIATAGGALGYGVTFLNFFGAGVSTSFYDSVAGIATIFFEGGGGGGGAIGIGSTFPGTPASVDPEPNNGDLFFHIDYGRTFIYYDEVILGVGSSAFWIDSSPFNIGIITALSGGISFSDGTSLSPSWYFSDDQTTGVFSPVNGELTFVSTGSSVLNINSSGVVVNGVTTSSSFVGNLTGTATGLSGTPNVTVGVVTATSVSVSGNVSIAGTLTYEDVTNVDSIGIVTARAGAHVATVSGNLLVGTTSETGTASQPLQVTGGAYVSSNVGIGITNPSNTLFQVKKGTSSSYTEGSLTWAGKIINANDSSTEGGLLVGNRWRASNSYIFAAGGTYSFTTGDFLYDFVIKGDGSVGIATTTPSEKLHVIGNILASGNVTGYSDETLKDNVKTIPDALSKVTLLRGVEFDRNDIEGNPHQIGVIAQEVEKVIPEVVTTHDDGIKSVAYGNLVGVLIEAIKELKEEVNELKARLEEV